MIFITELGRGRPRRSRVNFGEIGRSHRHGFDEIELEKEDLQIMLDTPDHELKSKIYDVLRLMENNEQSRRRDRKHYSPSDRVGGGAPSPSNPYGEDGWWDIPTPTKFKLPPKPDKSGLLWTED